MFAFAGLSWSEQTEAFINRSTQYGGQERFYQVWRDTSKPDSKWKDMLSDADRAAIGAIVGRSSLAGWLTPDRMGPADTVEMPRLWRERSLA
jgi:hypothetical protein